MTAAPWWFPVLAVSALAIQRVLELRRSRGNEARALSAGGRIVETAQERGLIVLHATWLAGTIVESLLRGVPVPSIWPLFLVLFLAGQGLRWWAILTLGERWTTRIVVWPERPPVRAGPYRFLKHPNYLGVALELLAFPLLFGAQFVAVGASVANAALLIRRVEAEERALGDAEVEPPSR
jgi:methyltransferase